MRLDLIAIGRLRGSPERILTDDYLKRADGLGRGLGLAPVKEIELDPKGKSDSETQTLALASAAANCDRICILDEHGKTLSSRNFASLMAGWRNEGAASAAFLIGGADGLDKAKLPRIDASIAFGKMTWPHRLARVMLAEQIYRAMTILAGSPYHRD